MKNFAERIAVVLFFAANVFALQLAGNQTQITANTNASPHTLTNEFDFQNGLVVWIDSRDDVNYVPRIYASYVNDATHSEYLIEADAADVSMLKTDGRYIVYPVWINSMQVLRIADAANISNPVVTDITCESINTFDIDNGVVVFKENGSSQTVYAVSLADPAKTKHQIKAFAASDYISTNIAIDCNTVVWSGEYYDEENWTYNNYLDIVDISNLSDPVVRRNILPKNAQGNYVVWLNALDISGNWLIARGTYNESYCVIGMHNFSSTTDYSFVTLHKMDGYKEFALRLDSPYAVWVEADSVQPQMQTLSDSETFSAPNFIAGAVLWENGTAAVSILKTPDDANWILSGAAVSGGKIVWGANRASSESEASQNYSGLFSDTLQKQCGDRGYLKADLNLDCKINLADFATFAQEWLACTTPETCIDGEIY